MRIMEWGIYNKFKCMNFGISTEEKGKKINFGLSSFKESFGGLDITRNTFRKDLNA
jgi:lipid II:glycine glycyltransferase (peptidoglycan interpeptide bridge formation enzyme)